jgi:redox-sensitive bicupin YhaK (pirin superfamily)
VRNPALSTLVLDVQPLGFTWPTLDPFLFCVHHDDAYPQGNEQLGPAASLAGRALGQDFEGRDGWRMYHGHVVPGFPQHPHRGFETVTIARRGAIDHSDSLGATARFGAGDVQWLTAGAGIVHAEMFPLLHRDRPNPVELFQIWLNLPSTHKLVSPRFVMLWGRDIPRHVATDSAGRRTEVTVIAGSLGAQRALAPPPDSWAAQPDADVAIWSIRIAPGAQFVLPKATHVQTRRLLYFFSGGSLRIGGEELRSHAAVALRATSDSPLEAGDGGCELLLLQGRPIEEPVAQHGPFVMNSRAELLQAFEDYRRTGFGGWPWPTGGPVHAREMGRFAHHPDGRVERIETGL